MAKQRALTNSSKCSGCVFEGEAVGGRFGAMARWRPSLKSWVVRKGMRFAVCRMVSRVARETVGRPVWME